MKSRRDFELLYPNCGYNTIRVPKNKKIKLTCLDQEFSKLHANTVVAKCLEDNRFLVRGRKVNLSELECERFPTTTLLRTNRTCYRDSTEFAVGFQLSRKFLTTMSVCFDETHKRVVYSWYESPMLHTGYQMSVRRPPFVYDDVYDFNVNKVYFRKEQVEVFAQTLRSRALAEKYIGGGNSSYYLARGHLTPKADFVYGSEQASSFHYANVAPQWQVFNDGNWRRVEDCVRRLLLTQPNRYGVLTGTYGIATLPDINHKQQELYLHMDSSGKKLPIPKLFWKTVYDKQTARGVTILGLNNPYIHDIPQDFVICRDICNRVYWFDVDLRNVTRGYLYCCEMNEFFRATGYKNFFHPDEISKRRLAMLEKQKEEDYDYDELEETESTKSKPSFSRLARLLLLFLSKSGKLLAYIFDLF